MIRQISYANFNLLRRRRRNKKKEVWTVRWIAFYVLQHFKISGAHDKANAGLMNNNLQPFDRNLDEAVVFKDEEIGDGMLAASSYNTLDNFKQPNGPFCMAGQYWDSQHDASSFRRTPRQRLLVKSGTSCVSGALEERRISVQKRLRQAAGRVREQPIWWYWASDR